MNTPRKAGRYLEIEVSKARVERQWDAVRRSLAPSSSRVRWRRAAFAFAFVSALAAVLLIVRIRRAPTNVTGAGAVLESVAGQTLTLADGSRVEIAARARLRVGVLEANHTELVLEQGRATFDVTHAEGRRFVVHAGPFDIVDIGTRFEVSVDQDGGVAVSVDRGRVQLQRRDSSEPPRFLGAGERWTNVAADHAALETPTTTAETTPSSSANVETPPTQNPATSASTTPTAKDIFESAERARREGHSRKAASQLDNLRRHYRSDPRAGLASFELGRLRLDELSDPEGAATAFQDAIVLAPNAPFREDAEARLVDAYAASADYARCVRARDAYAAHYPRGLYASIVASRCAP